MKLRTLYTAILFIVILINGCNAQGKGCFASNYMISCLSILCEFGGSCPGDPDAVCRVERPDKCAGCEMVWYRRDGTKANCGSRQNLKLCPGGEPVVHCKVDSCKWPCTHPEFKDLPCRQSFCGRCQAEYLFGDQWLKCPKSTTGFSGETLPVDLAVRERTTKACMHIPCPLDACVHQDCLKVPEASCRPDGCNKCLPAWYLGNKPVDCHTGEIFPPVSIEPIDPLTGDRRVCASGESLMACTDSVCAGETCPNYPRAVCRPDGCGQCRATWYDENVLVDCFATECPANVMRVKCIVDPCIYFSHYCPAAECRASECGRCEAKFYVGDKEISCVQPPKKCLPGENTMVCPWYTCPNTVCPSNLNLMCRINPCGLTCQREWVNVKTGEIEPCRSFEKRPPSNKNFERIFMQDPLASVHDNSFLPDEKPYIEVKKIPVKTVVKTLESKSVAPAAKGFAFNDVASMAVPIPMKETLPAKLRHEIAAMSIPIKETVPEKIHPDIAAIPIPMKETAPARIQHEIAAVPIPLKETLPAIGANGQLAPMSIPMKHSGHMGNQQTSGPLPIPVKENVAFESPMRIPVTIHSKPWTPGVGNVVMLGGNDPELNNLLFEILGANKIDNFPITSEMHKAVEPLGAMTDTVGILPPPMKARKPTLQTRNNRFQMKPDPRFFQNPDVADNIVQPIETDPPTEQNLLIDNLPTGMQMSGGIPTVQDQRIFDNTQGIMSEINSVPFDLRHSVKAIPPVQKHPVIDKTQVIMTKLDNIPTVQAQPMVENTQMKLTRLDNVPTIQQNLMTGTAGIVSQNALRGIPFGENAVISGNPDMPVLGSSALINQNQNVEKAPVLMELINNQPVPLKKKAGKPLLRDGHWPLIGGQTNSNFDADSSGIPLKKPAGKPKAFKPLYPELELIQENVANQRFKQFLMQTGAHKNVPIKKDSSKPIRIPNAIPPLIPKV